MKRTRLLAVVMLLVAGALPARAREGLTELVFVGYPDPSEFLTARILRRVGEAYQESNPEVRIRVETGLGYLAARKLVLEGEATAMMISDMMNEPRAYQTQHSVSGAHATYDLELNRFLPIAVRPLRSKEKTLAQIRLGVVTNRIPVELRDFLDFLSTEQARRAVAGIDYIELARPAESPTPIKEVHYKRQKVTLKQPILSY